MKYHTTMITSFFDIEYPSGFPNLSHAPIAEAVIEFRIISKKPWNPDTVRDALKKAVPNAKKIGITNEYVYQLSIGGATPKEEKFGCVGYKVMPEEEKYIVQFNQKGFVFSCVNSYSSWDDFVSKARFYWEIYKELLSPENVKRIGVRYVNKMAINKEPFHLKDYYILPPIEKQVEDWELADFLHKESFIIPDTAYRVNLIKTIQEKSIILDTDTFLVHDCSCSWDLLCPHLNDIRLIKNKVFFGNIQKSKIQEYV